MEQLIDNLLFNRYITFDDEGDEQISWHARNEIEEFFFNTEQCKTDHFDEGIFDKATAEEDAMKMARATNCFQHAQRSAETQWNEDFHSCYDTPHRMNK